MAALIVQYLCVYLTLKYILLYLHRRKSTFHNLSSRTGKYILWSEGMGYIMNVGFVFEREKQLFIL